MLFGYLFDQRPLGQSPLPVPDHEIAEDLQFQRAPVEIGVDELHLFFGEEHLLTIMLQKRPDFVVRETAQFDDGEDVVERRGQLSGQAQFLQRRHGSRYYRELAPVELRTQMIEKIIGELRRMVERRLEFIQAKHDAPPISYLLLDPLGEGCQVAVERFVRTNRVGVQFQLLQNGAEKSHGGVTLGVLQVKVKKTVRRIVDLRPPGLGQLEKQR